MMRAFPFRLLLLAAVLLPAPRQAEALDVVVLKSGTEMRGEIVARTDAALRIDLLPGEISLPLGDVREVKAEDNPAWYLNRVKGREPAVAVAILDSALRSGCSAAELRSKYVQCSAKAAEKLLADDQPAAAAELCGRALLVQPDSPALANLQRKAESSVRRADAEVKALKAELARNPGNDYARFLLGETLRKLGRADDAWAEYQTIIAGKIDFPGGKAKVDELRRFIRDNLKIDDPAAETAAAQALPMAEQAGAASVFRISFYDPSLGAQLAENLPAIHEQVAKDLQCPPLKAQCTVRVLRTRGDFIEQTGNAFGDGFSSGDCVWTYHGARGILDNVIPHELAHVILGRAFGELPTWLGEGLAIRQEARAGTYWDVLRDGGALTVPSLLARRRSASKQENDRFYASAYGFVDLLAGDGGMPKIHQLIAALKTQPPEAAFQTVYGIRSLEELQERWRKHLQE